MRKEGREEKGSELWSKFTKLLQSRLLSLHLLLYASQRDITAFVGERDYSVTPFKLIQSLIRHTI